MKLSKNKTLLIALIATLSLSTGCGISISRNYYYNYPEESVKNTNKKVALIKHSEVTSSIKKNGQN